MGKTLMVDVLQDGGASVPGTGAFQWVLWAVFVQIVVLAGGWICYKALFPALRFGIKFCSALIMDSNDDPEWEATMRRSREMKDAKKRENEESEKQRQAAKAQEREKRKRKMEIEQKKLDQDHQQFLSEKEAQALSERDEKKRIDKAKREAEEQRTKEWILERKRREQEQLEKTEHDRQRKLGAMKLDADAEKALAGGVETRARSNSKDSDCSTTPDSTRSQEAVNIVLEERLKEDSSSLRKERKSRKESESRGKESSVDTTPTSTRSEHHISMKDVLMRGAAAEGAARGGGEAVGEDAETDIVKAERKMKQESVNNRRGGKKRTVQPRTDGTDSRAAAVSIELPAPRPPAPIAQAQQPPSRQQESTTPRLVPAAPISAPASSSLINQWSRTAGSGLAGSGLDAESDPPFNPSATRTARWSLNAESDPELIPAAAPSRNQWSLNSEDDPIVAPIGSIGRKVAPIGSIGSKSVAPIGCKPTAAPIQSSSRSNVGGRW